MQQKIVLKTLFPPVRMLNLYFWDYPLIFVVVTFDLYVDDVAHSVILLINTIYFNGYWVEQFAKNETAPRNFWVNSKASSPAQFMTKTSNFYYGESVELDAKFLRLPYKVNVSVLISLEKPYWYNFHFIQIFQRVENLPCILCYQPKLMGLKNLYNALTVPQFTDNNFCWLSKKLKSRCQNSISLTLLNWMTFWNL